VNTAGNKAKPIAVIIMVAQIMVKLSITPTDDATRRRDLPLIIVTENIRNYLNK
jgi:hypothetical protein